jgi:predicted nicotinamide N-methyase
MTNGNGPKPETAIHQRQVCGLTLPRSSHPGLRRIKRHHRPAHQGFKVWNSTWVLLDFLSSHRLPPSPTVLDAGCGWGLAGIGLARHRRASVLAADIDPAVFPFLDFCAQLNGVSPQQAPVGFDLLGNDILATRDLLISADTCYSPNLVQPLFELLQRALDCGVSRIAVADPGRAPFRRLSRLALDHLGARQLDWSAPEPVVSWPGKKPQLQSQLLLCGDFPPTSNNPPPIKKGIIDG